MNQLDKTVAYMMRLYGTAATITVAVSEAYDPSTSENTVSYQDYPVKAMFFDYLRKSEGLGVENNTLIQTGDKQVYVQPPQKALGGTPIPNLSPNIASIKLGDKTYKIIALKQHNPSMTDSGCVLYELYVRE